MPVLTLAGKPINWASPPKPTDRVMWSNKTSSGKKVTGSFRTIAHLDYMNSLAVAKFKSPIVVLQPPYNTGVAKSAGTHDYDACIDSYIPGVSWLEQQSFFRANGAGAYWRRPPAFDNHIHYFCLPLREGKEVSDDYAVAGFKVGKYVDGGYSTVGRRIASSQIEDYYLHRSALSGHRPDPTWFPPNINATIFDLNAYIARQRAAIKPDKYTAYFRVATNNVMALPVNPEVRETIEATPSASVLLLQEAEIYHKEARSTPGYRAVPIPLRRNAKGEVLGEDDRINAVILYRPNVWTYVTHRYVKQYDGKAGISKTRHICEAILKHKSTGVEVAFLSYHAVTAGKDADRQRMRKEGDNKVRSMKARLQKAGYPVILGTDANTTKVVYPTARVKVRNVLDHVYAWFSPKVKFKVLGSHAVKTNSDHDALVVNIQMEIKK